MMDEEKIEEYVECYAEKHRIKKAQARRHRIVQAVKEYYDQENRLIRKEDCLEEDL